MAQGLFNLPRELMTQANLDRINRGLKDKSFAAIRKLRDKESTTGAKLNAMAALDRGAFAELVAKKEGPVVAAMIALGIPGDFIAKEFGIKIKGLFEGRSKPGIVGMKEGIKGIGRGLRLFGPNIRRDVQRLPPVRSRNIPRG